MLRAVLAPHTDGTSRFLRAACALLVLATMAGCDVTPEKISTWKASDKGPGKLREALKNDTLPSDLRAEVLIALVEIGMSAEAQEELRELPEAQRKAVVHAAVRPLILMAAGGGRGTALASTTRLQREGKDALYGLRDSALPDDRALMDDALIEWTAEDLTGRMTAGAHSTEQILSAIGTRAGPRLVKVITDEVTSDANRTEAARFLGRLGDRAAREQVGASLVARARREKQLSDTTLQQLGSVGGDHVVAFLTAAAAEGDRPAAVRARSLRELSLSADPASLPMALRLAADRKAPGDVRDAAFDLAQKIGPAAVPGLARLLDDKVDMVRWRAVEAMLSAGKAEAIPAALEGLSPARAYPKEDFKAFVTHPLVQLGPASLPTLREELKSKSWVARLAAATAIAELAKADDAAALEALGSDGTRIKGWPGTATVGAEAKLLAAALRQKK